MSRLPATNNQQPGSFEWQGYQQPETSNQQPEKAIFVVKLPIL
jgi:hypothetical protein